MSDRDHWVYKCYDAYGGLLYVGITWQAMHRHAEHRVDSSWASQVDVIRIEHFDTRAEALQRELDLIHELNPRYNRLGAKPRLELGELSVEDVARLLGFSRQWVYNQIHSGKLDAVQKQFGGRLHWIVPQHSYDDFITDSAAEPQPEAA
jgi:predicted GIY-YIG superfamily endonuclease